MSLCFVGKKQKLQCNDGVLHRLFWLPRRWRLVSAMCGCPWEFMVSCRGFVCWTGIILKYASSFYSACTQSTCIIIHKNVMCACTRACMYACQDLYQWHEVFLCWLAFSDLVRALQHLFISLLWLGCSLGAFDQHTCMQAGLLACTHKANIHAQWSTHTCTQKIMPSPSIPISTRRYFRKRRSWRRWRRARCTMCACIFVCICV